MSDLRIRLSQFLIDFGEDRMMAAQSIAEKRAMKYGDFSWQWRWTVWQEGFWFNFSCFSLYNL